MRRFASICNFIEMLYPSIRITAMDPYFQKLSKGELVLLCEQEHITDIISAFAKQYSINQNA